ncbi:unnamed protein product [Prunus armeniaca]
MLVGRGKAARNWNIRPDVIVGSVLERERERESERERHRQTERESCLSLLPWYNPSQEKVVGREAAGFDPKPKNLSLSLSLFSVQLLIYSGGSGIVMNIGFGS